VEPARAVQHEVAQDRQRPAIANDAAISGAFQLAPGVPRLPRLPLAIALPLMIGLPPLLLSRTVATVLDAIPAPWLVALQVYRVFGGIFLVNWAHGAVSGYFAWPAGIGDVITGLMALPVALAVASGTAQGRRAALLWNIFGLLDFAVAITMGLLSAPGPLQRFGFEIAASQASAYPTVMIPDRVPLCGVGALLPGGLDRRVRLR
jgi:hypothetical protein